jgi:hypothetical protein
MESNNDAAVDMAEDDKKITQNKDTNQKFVLSSLVRRSSFLI